MIEKPVLLIGCPRSGTTLLYHLLSEVSSLWSLGYESKAILEHFHHPASKGWQSGGLEAGDLTPESQVFIRQAFVAGAAPGTFWRRINRGRRVLNRFRAWRWLKRRGQTQAAGSAATSAAPQAGLDLIRRFVHWRNGLRQSSADLPIRLLEKTPENCLRLPFLEALFPDASVIFLVRNGNANVSSLMEGWRQPHLFPGYQVPEKVQVPGIDRDRWAFTLIPGWRELLTRSLEEICALQWIRCNEAVLAYLRTGKLPALRIRYEDLIQNPGAVLARVAAFIGVDYDRELSHFSEGLPWVNVVSDPGEKKWLRKNQAAVLRVKTLLNPLMGEFGYDD